MGEAKASRGRATRLKWAAGFALGALAGLVLGLAVGPTGAALLGFRLPYLRLSLADPSARAAVPAPASAPIGPAAPAAKLQPVAATMVRPTPLATPAGRTLSIGVFGDSMADGLWSALYRDFHKTGAVDVLRFAQNSTGFTRYDYVDVQEQTKDQLAQHHVDIAVVMFGANDGQGILADDGHVYAWGTPNWQKAYAARVDALVGLLRSQGAQVYWVGLPRMEKADVDRRATFLNTLFQARMAALGVPFIPTLAVTEDAQGRYDAYLPAPGEAHPRLMRAPDGIHMTMAGYLRLAGPVAARIHSDLAAATQLAAQAARPAAPTQTQTQTQTQMQAEFRLPPATVGPVQTAEQP